MQKTTLIRLLNGNKVIILFAIMMVLMILLAMWVSAQLIEHIDKQIH